jgi:uncharacterized protein (DUF1330 family)
MLDHAGLITGTIRVTDSAVWRTYVDSVDEMFAPFSGRALFRGVKAAALKLTRTASAWSLRNSITSSL